MVDAIADLISMSRKYAKSRYTRSSHRAKWTRLAGQLIWYKDQVLRAMSYEALEQDLHAMLRAIFKDGDVNKPLIAQPILPIVRSHWTPGKIVPAEPAKGEEREDKGIHEEKAENTESVQASDSKQQVQS